MTRRSLIRAAGWSATWAFGVALGVVLGAYLTLAGSAATPGQVRLDTTELIALPAIAGAGTFLLSMGARLLIASWRLKRTRTPAGE